MIEEQIEDALERDCLNAKEIQEHVQLKYGLILEISEIKAYLAKEHPEMIDELAYLIQRLNP
jgi:hypothetical protein